MAGVLNFAAALTIVIAWAMSTHACDMRWFKAENNTDNWTLNWSDIARHRCKVTSQKSQDGVLKYIFDVIETANRFFVEFGFNAAVFDGGSGANTYQLKVKGWKGLLLDGGNENPDINLHKHFITAENIVSLLEKYKVPSEVDYISIDLDSIDLWVFRAIISSKKFRPRVVSVEYNCNYPVDATITLRPDAQWDNHSRLYGSSLGALQLVAEEFGYELVFAESFLDAFFVRGDIAFGRCEVFYVSLLE